MLARCLAIAFCAVVLFVGVDHADMYRNEGLRASLAAELLAGESWIVPSLHGEPHLTKPPGMSILIALCSLPTGQVTPITARLPSILAGAAFMGLFGWTVARWFGTGAGWLAALFLPCCPLWLDRVPSAEIDLVQLAWVGGSLLCLLHAVETDSRTWWLGAMACVAGGLFTKWTAPLFFYMTAIPWLWWQGRLRLLLQSGHLLGLLGVAVLATGWLGLVVLSVGWNLLFETLSREALLRFSPAHHPRPYPWDELATFPLGFIAACLPCSLGLVVAFRPSFAQQWNDPQRAFLRLCQVWLVGSLIFWTLAPGHRPRHLLPAQPAIVGLAVMAAIAWGRAWSKARWRVAVSGLLVCWLAVKLVFVGWVLPIRQAHRHPREGAEILANVVPASEILYVCRLKDDGLLFHYARRVRRIRGESDEGSWCLLTCDEWATWVKGRGEIMAELKDGQGASLVLVRRQAARSRIEAGNTAR